MRRYDGLPPRVPIAVDSVRARHWRIYQVDGRLIRVGCFDAVCGGRRRRLFAQPTARRGCFCRPALGIRTIKVRLCPAQPLNRLGIRMLGFDVHRNTTLARVVLIGDRAIWLLATINGCGSVALRACGRSHSKRHGGKRKEERSSGHHAVTSIEQTPFMLAQNEAGCIQRTTSHSGNMQTTRRRFHPSICCGRRAHADQ
jgi:hypothetical protein